MTVEVVHLDRNIEVSRMRWSVTKNIILAAFAPEKEFFKFCCHHHREWPNPACVKSRFLFSRTGESHRSILKSAEVSAQLNAILERAAERASAGGDHASAR